MGILFIATVDHLVLFNGITYIKWNMGLWKQHGPTNMWLFCCVVHALYSTRKKYGVCLCLNLFNHQGIIQQWEHVMEFNGISLGKQ